MATSRLFPVLTISVVVGTVGGVWWLASRPAHPPRVAATTAESVSGEPQASPTFSEPVRPVEAAGAAEGTPEPAPVLAEAGEVAAESSAAYGADLRRIEEAMVTYSVEALPRLKPYLLHADAGVRQAARDALLQMGLGEASPILREAAERVRDPREAVLMLDLADYLDLPSIPPSSGRKRLVGPAPEPRERPSDGGVRPSR